MSIKREHEDVQREGGRMIPIYVRFVPKDIWIRLHIDSRSTIGFVKDAVLEKVKMPPYDPTVLPDFYDEARYAMVKPAFLPSEARAFPKAFMARCPKRNVAEVMESDSKKIIGKELWDPIQSSPSKFNSRLKGKGPLSIAKELLGGDPGEGGLGSMSYIGDIASTNILHKTQDGEMTRSPTASKLLNSVIGARSPRLKASMLSLSTTAAKDIQKDLLYDPTVTAGFDAYSDYTTRREERPIVFPIVTSSPPTNKLLNSFRGAKSPRLKANISSSNTATKGVPKETPMDLSYDPTVDAGLDAYTDHLPVTLLFGNANALEKEEEAKILLDKMDSTSPTSHGSEKVIPTSPKRSRLMTHSSISVSSSIHDASLANHPEQTDLELDDSSSDDESVHSHNKGARTKSLLSSGSDSSNLSLMNKSHFLVSRFKKKGHIKVASLLGASVSSSDINSLALNNATIERAKSTNLIAGPEVQSVKSSAQMMRINSDISVGSATHILSLRAAAGSNSSLNQFREHTGHGSEGGRSIRKGVAGESLSNSGSANSRIAGIQLDEISAWKDAQHALSKFFCVYSYSNGHMLEDWRTVAAFRLRPFELLEIQYSSPQERLHLPRGGLDHVVSTTLSSQRPSTGSLVEMERFNHYIAPCCEGWCYIFKRNSGNNKAQRAGLGVWKLRYISIRGSRLVIYRKRPARSSINDLQNTLTWNTELIKCVFSERADGWTRPALMPLQGLSNDIVTLIFSAEASPPAFVNSETLGWIPSSHVSLSMRFISQMDACAFFNAFARATTISMKSGDRRPSRFGNAENEYRRKVVTRATIAGRGGSILPGRAGREGGRNSLARSRLRPTGVSREFDDVDRWSSHSEEEGNDKVTSNKAFKYTDLHGSESDSNKNLKDAFFDPSYNITPSNTMPSLQNRPPIQSSMSPRGEMASLIAEEQQKVDRPNKSNSTQLARLSVDSGVKTTRTRGFSFAKAARKALAPSDSSFHSLYQKSVRAGSASEEGKVVNGNDSDRRRRSAQPDIVSARTNTDDDDSTGYAPPSSSPKQQQQRSGTPTRLASMGNINRNSQQISSSAAAVVGRHRSYTLASSNSPPLQSNNRRSIGMRNTSSSSSTGSNFHWPFRALRTHSVADSKIILTDDVAVVDKGENTSGQT